MDVVCLMPLSHNKIYGCLRKNIPKTVNIVDYATAARAALLGPLMAGSLKKNVPHSKANALMMDMADRLKEKNPVLINSVCNALEKLQRKRCI